MFEAEKIIAKSKKGAERREEAQESGELEDAINRINQPLHSSKYASGNNQEISFDYEGFKITVKYSEVSAENSDAILIAQAKLEKELPDNSPALKSENWKQLDQLLVRMPDGEIQNILESVPDEYPVFFCPANTNSNPKGFIYEQPTQGIFYAGDIGTVAGISVLAHEIGHLHNENLLPEQERMRTTNHRDQDVATKILRERYANAFALKKLRPFITNPQDREDILVLLRHYGQGSYDHVLTKVNQARTNAEQAAFYAELQVIMQEEQGHDIFGLDDDGWESDWEEDED